MTTVPLSLFISYSHKDDELRGRLEAHLSLLRRQRIFEVWHDRRISPGREWVGEVDDALERADVILLLVSSDFLASDYCFDKEMTRALKRHEEGSARVVPVILRRCDWRASPFAKLQALPRDGNPITAHADVDEALTEVAVRLRELSDELHPERSGTASRSPVPHVVRRWFQARSLRRHKSWAIAAVAMLTATGIGGAYVVNGLDEATDLMRRGEYSRAAKRLEPMSTWAAFVPSVHALDVQARFGARLQAGEHIRTLAPELKAIADRWPDSPDVLVYQGFKAYYVDNDASGALAHFSNASRRDASHIEAHFLAADRLIDEAYMALGENAQARANELAGESRRLMEEGLKHAAFAGDLPRYSNQMASLYQLQGDARAAYQAYAKVAPLHPLSAVEGLFASWRLEQEGIPALAIENAEQAFQRLSDPKAADTDQSGWMLRLGPNDLIDVRSRLEKACIAQLAIWISRAESTSADALPKPAGECAVEPTVTRARDVVCVQMATAESQLPGGHPRRQAFRKFRDRDLKCGDTRALPILRSALAARAQRVT